MSSQAGRSAETSGPVGDVPQAGGARARAARAGAGLPAPATAARMAAAARALHGAVTGNNNSVLNPGFDDFDLGSPRRQWTYLPELERPGLPLRALSDAQRKLAHELITASVSMEGYAKVVSVMAMEHVRRALVLASAPERAHLFDPERYCFRIFGDPGGLRSARPRPWGWQLAGHHVSLNFTVAGDEGLGDAVHARLGARVLRRRSARSRTRRRTGTRS